MGDDALALDDVAEVVADVGGRTSTTSAARAASTAATAAESGLGRAVVITAAIIPLSSPGLSGRVRRAG